MKENTTLLVAFMADQENNFFTMIQTLVDNIETDLKRILSPSGMTKVILIAILSIIHQQKSYLQPTVVQKTLIQTTMTLQFFA